MSEAFDKTTATSDGNKDTPRFSHADRMPSTAEREKAAGARQFPSCSLPDFKITDEDLDHQDIERTPKRITYDQLAEKALNGAIHSGDGTPSAQENDAARSVAQLALKSKKDLDDLSHSEHNYDDDLDKMRGQFRILSSDAQQRVIAEADKILEKSGMRIAKSATGEIWLGSRENESAPYHLGTMLKDSDCGPND